MYKNLEEAQKAFLESRLEENRKELEEINKELAAINEQHPIMAAELGVSEATLDDIERQANEIFEKRYGHLDTFKMTEEQHFELYAPILESLLSPTPDIEAMQ